MRISDWSSDVCSSDLIIGDQADRQRVGRFEKQLAAKEITIAVVDVAVVVHIVQEAVALHPYAVDARGERVADRPGDAAPEAPIIIIAIGDLTRGAELEIGLFRIDADQARSEEHTSELQSLMRISYAVFCLKKKKTQYK